MIASNDLPYMTFNINQKQLPSCQQFFAKMKGAITSKFTLRMFRKLRMSLNYVKDTLINFAKSVFMKNNI